MKTPKGPNPIPPVAIVKNVKSGDNLGPSTSGKSPKGPKGK